jgi:DNA polymerase-3 subunit alpha
MRSDFIHLRLQSSYSFLESALTIDQIVSLTKSQKMPSICLSDRGNLFGALEFALTCSKQGVQPIHGSILNILYLDDEQEYFAEILLIAKDEIGYKNLLKLVSYSFIKNDRKICNHVTFEDLEKHSDGIILLSSYIDGIIGRYLLAQDKASATFYARKFQNIFGDRFYFEIMRHNTEQEIFIETNYINIAYDLSIPLVATNKVLFSDISMHETHDVLLCIASGVTKEQDERKRVSAECYFKSTIEILDLFKDLPEAIENTVNIAQRCSVMSEVNPLMLPNFTNSGVSEEDFIRNNAETGLLARLETKFKSENVNEEDKKEIKSQYIARLTYELDIICKMNFAGYFLIVSDFIKWSKEQGISVGPGRGSGVGSVVAWSLLITDLDPIKFGLLFERFLNPERISMPDFDIDFCQERREEVINYVRSKYGDSRVGQIITFGKLQAKAVIKDVSRVLGLPYRYADYLTTLVPFNAITPVTLTQAINEVAELKEASIGNGLYNLAGENNLIRQVLSTSTLLEGLHRHASVHAAGIVIAGQDLTEIVPVYKDINSDMLVVQYSMKYAELAGLIKFDFLGLQTLTVITKCQELLKKQGININFDNISFDDTKTYQMLSEGHGTGVFQFESVGMKDALRRLKPDSIRDIIALGALYRPGPMENIPTYIANKHGKQKPDYLHDSLKATLDETYGVIIYQEQVLEIARILAGYSLGSADLLRRAMGKKIKSEMKEQEVIFIKGATANNVPQSQAKSIFDTVAKFAGYGFNKAHASAYGVISYQTAYLKANFPLEFLTACLNLETDNFDKINAFIQEVKNNNIKIIPPSINLSDEYFSIDKEEKTLIYGLMAIKGIGINVAKIIVAERKKNGGFKDITNFIERIPQKTMNRKAFENLIKAGCFDSLHENRNQLLLSIPKLLLYGESYAKEKSSKQFSLFAVNSTNIQVLVDAEFSNNKVLAFHEFEVLGLFMNLHPLSEYYDLIPKFNITNSLNLQTNLENGTSQIKIAGVIQKKDSRMSARGRFITLQLSDQFGIFELTIFREEILKTYVHLLNIGTIVVATCDVVKDDGSIRLTAKSFEGLEEIIQNMKFELKLSPNNHSELCCIIDLLKSHINYTCSNTQITLLLPVQEEFLAKINLPDHFLLKINDIEMLKSKFCYKSLAPLPEF